MNVIALITARGGSKGLPGKNIRDFHGHPLIAWSVAHALNTKSISRVVVSTDDPKIAAISLEYGAELPFSRPVSLAQDTSTSIDVALHAINFLEDKGEKFDVLVLLQPTSPIRHSSDLQGMLDLLKDNWESCDGIVTIHPMKPSPAQGLLVKNGMITLYEGFKPVLRQELETVYSSFGVAWAIKVETIKKEKTFHPSAILPWKLKRFQAVDIDDEADFVTAEALFSLAYKNDHGFKPSFKKE